MDVFYTRWCPSMLKTAVFEKQNCQAHPNQLPRGDFSRYLQAKAAPANYRFLCHGFLHRKISLRPVGPEPPSNNKQSFRRIKAHAENTPPHRWGWWGGWVVVGWVEAMVEAWVEAMVEAWVEAMVDALG